MLLAEIRVKFPGEDGIRILQPDDILTVPEAAKRLKRFKSTLYRRIDAGKIHCIKLGGILFIPLSELDKPCKNEETGGG